MALYYNLTQLIQEAHHNDDALIEKIIQIVHILEKKLPKLDKSISKKRYDKVLKHTLTLDPIIGLLKLETLKDLNEVLIHWAEKKGNRTEGETIFFSYKKQFCLMIKELKKDFKIL